MKRLSFLIVATMLCMLLVACQTTEEVTIERTFLAGYEVGAGEEESEQKSARVLMNLMSDGTVEWYVGTVEQGQHNTAKYQGTYTLGENEEYDETISFSCTYAEGKTIETVDVVIIDSIFESPFYLFEKMTDNKIKFYETAPASMDGDVYVGYLTKTSGMGAMAYAYALCLKEDNTFDVSIMQMASVMHVWGATNGTYIVNGEDITFTYDILTTEGEIVAEDEIAEGVDYSNTTLSTAFNIQQATMCASNAPFIKVK